MSAEPHVVFEGASKRFADGTLALDDVTFGVTRGQVCALVGPSGSGKSTLLRAVNGLTELTGGAMRVDGKPVDAAHLPQIRRKVGMVHQHYGLVDRASVAENMIAGTCVGLAAQGMRPVAEIQFMGFLYPAVDQIVNHMSRLRHRTRGRLSCPVVLRTPHGGGIHAPEHHSEAVESMIAHVPGIRVVCHTTPAAKDAANPAAIAA